MPNLHVSEVSQFHIRIRAELLAQLKRLARQRRTSASQLVRELVGRELTDADSETGALPDESAIREMAILIAVELVLKLQEASIPGGVTLSRRLLEDAARAAIARIELVESRLREETGR